MISAGIVVTLLESSVLPVQSFIPDPLLRRVLIGVAMGLTAIALIYSPWGKRSGAHFNPAVTLAFFRLGKLSSQDAFWYILAQFLGGLTGVILVTVIFSTFFTAPPVNYIVTVPGKGWFLALVVELLMSFGLMLMVLFVSNNQNLAKFTGLLAGVLVATYIILAAPISGMSINPARSFASAFPAHIWTAFWLYYFAPPLGMLLAAEIYLKYPKRPKVICGKLCPNSETLCICKHCCCEEI
jgi:aquaporin Z